MQYLVKVHLHRLLCIQLGEGRELIGCVGEYLDVLQYYSCHLVELLLPFRIVVLLEADKPLDFKLYRCKRVLDLVRHLACHLAPCVVALGLGQLPCGVGKILDHSVVCIHE